MLLAKAAKVSQNQPDGKQCFSPPLCQPKQEEKHELSLMARAPAVDGHGQLVVEDVHPDGVLAQHLQVPGQAARVVPLVAGAGPVQGQVADEGVLVGAPRVDHDAAPVHVRVENHPAPGTLEHPLHRGVLQGGSPNLGWETH